MLVGGEQPRQRAAARRDEKIRPTFFACGPRYANVWAAVECNPHPASPVDGIATAAYRE